MSAEELLLTAERLQQVRYFQVIAMSLLVSDWTILFSSEIELIWKSPWTLTKVLYLLSRYSPFIDTPLNLVYYLTPDIRPEMCDTVYSICTWITGFGIGLAELVLLVRTYAIYERSRNVLIALGALWLLWVGGNIAVLYFFTNSVQYVEQTVLGLNRNLPGCYTKSESPIIFVSFASLTLFEIVIVSMTVKKGFEHFRDAAYLNGRRLAFVLYRDGVLFFIALLVFSAANVVLDIVAPREYLDLLNTLTRVLHSIVCCRVLLNIRHAGRSDVDISHRFHSSESGYSSGTDVVFKHCCSERDRGFRVEGRSSMSRSFGLPVPVASREAAREDYENDEREAMEMERMEQVEPSSSPDLVPREQV
ncbi:hypothetical protein K474DRAFT_1664124 [Panus rudis PR-1116 ss-1]|nr:hypothetical protein K474DRAFT_1664124 [Panus rudis PR-1116 ss-1]